MNSIQKEIKTLLDRYDMNQGNVSKLLSGEL